MNQKLKPRYVYNNFGISESDASEFDNYEINGRAVNEDEGVNEFKTMREDFKQLIMYSGYEDDMSAFKYVKSETPVAVSLDEALAKLKE